MIFMMSGPFETGVQTKFLLQQKENSNVIKAGQNFFYDHELFQNSVAQYQAT
jgi:hypothetical protein